MEKKLKIIWQPSHDRKIRHHDGSVTMIPPGVMWHFILWHSGCHRTDLSQWRDGTVMWWNVTWQSRAVIVTDRSYDTKSVMWRIVMWHLDCHCDRSVTVTVTVCHMTVRYMTLAWCHGDRLIIWHLEYHMTRCHMALKVSYNQSVT